MGRPSLPQNERSEAQMGIRLTREERRQLNALQKHLGLGSAAQVVKLAIAELYQRTSQGTSTMPDVELAAALESFTAALSHVVDACDNLRRKVGGQ